MIQKRHNTKPLQDFLVLPDTGGQTVAVASLQTLPEGWQQLLAPNYAPADWADIKNAKRLREWVGARLLLLQMGMDQRIVYDAFGKPSLEGCKQGISITHTAQHVGIALSPQAHVGVDMETIGERVLRIRHKFLSAAELQPLPDGDPFLHTLYWSAKESLYKYHGKKGLRFRQHLQILRHTPTTLSPPRRSGSLACSISKDGFECSLQVEYRQIGGSVLTFTVG